MVGPGRRQKSPGLRRGRPSASRRCHAAGPRRSRAGRRGSSSGPPGFDQTLAEHGEHTGRTSEPPERRGRGDTGGHPVEPKPASTARENPTRMTANAGIRSARNGGTCSYKNRYIRPLNPSVRSTANIRPRAYAARTGDQGGHRATAASATATSPGNNRRSSPPNRSADHP